MCFKEPRNKMKYTTYHIPFVFSIYYAICDGGESNRQFINIHFSSFSPFEMNFLSYNMFTEEAMIFLMDCKVYYSYIISLGYFPYLMILY